MFVERTAAAVYTNDAQLIRRNTSVVVSRVPVSQPEDGVQKYAAPPAPDVGAPMRAGVPTGVRPPRHGGDHMRKGKH